MFDPYECVCVLTAVLFMSNHKFMESITQGSCIVEHITESLDNINMAFF